MLMPWKKTAGWVFLGLAAGLMAAMLCGTALLNLDSDSLYAEAVFKDLSQGLSLSGWAYPPAPSFFPDLGLYFLARVLMPGLGPAYVLYGCLSIFLLLGLLAAIGASVAENRGAALAGALTAGMVWLAFLQSSPELSAMAYPAFHTGALLNGFLLVWLFSRVLVGQSFWRGGILLFVLATAAVFSDRIIVPQFLVPLCLACGILAVTGPLPKKALLKPALITLAGTAFGLWVLFGVFRPGFWLGQVPQKSYLAPVFQQAMLRQGMAGSLPAILAGFPALAACLAATLWGVCRAFLNLKNRAPLGKEGPAEGARRIKGALLLWFVPLSLACTLLNALFLAEGAYARYLFPFFTLSIFGFAWFLPPRLAGRPGFLAKCLLGLAWAACLLFTGLRAGFHPPSLATPYPAKVEWLDRLSASDAFQYGYSDYWNAKAARCFSRAGLAFCPLRAGDGPGNGLKLQNWIDNLNRHVRDQQGAWPPFQAILLDGLPLESVREQFGPPEKEEVFGESRLWLYRRKSDVGFRNFLRKDFDASAFIILDPMAMSGRAKMSLPPRKSLFIKLSAPCRSGIAEVWAEPRAELNLHLFQGKQDLARVRMPKATGEGLRPRYLRLPDLSFSNGIDTIAFQNPGQAPVLLGECYLYMD